MESFSPIVCKLQPGALHALPLSICRSSVLEAASASKQPGLRRAADYCSPLTFFSDLPRHVWSIRRVRTAGLNHRDGVHLPTGLVPAHPGRHCPTLASFSTRGRSTTGSDRSGFTRAPKVVFWEELVGPDAG